MRFALGAVAVVAFWANAVAAQEQARGPFGTAPAVSAPLGVHGAPVRLRLSDPDGRRASGYPGATMSGELLAAAEDSLWLLADGTVLAFSRTAVTSVRVDRGKYGLGYAVKRGALFGLVTGVALGLACASVDGNEPGSCLAGSLVLSVGTSTVVGLIAGAFMQSDRYLTVRDPGTNAGLNAWARFPQGLPAGFPRSPITSAPTGAPR